MVPDWIEKFIEEHNQRVYAGLMSPRAKSVLRAMKKKEHEHYIALESRVDSNTGQDDQ